MCPNVNSVCSTVFLYMSIFFIHMENFCMCMLYIWVVNEECGISICSNFIDVVLVVKNLSTV
jgi:hypothetical protein